MRSVLQRNVEKGRGDGRQLLVLCATNSLKPEMIPESLLRERWYAELIASEVKMKVRPKECTIESLLKQWLDEGVYLQRMLTEYWTVRHDNADLTPSLKQLLSADMDFFKSIVHKETTLEQAWNPAQKDMITDTLHIVQKQINQISYSNRDLSRRFCHVLARRTLKNLDRNGNIR